MSGATTSSAIRIQQSLKIGFLPFLALLLAGALLLPAALGQSTSLTLGSASGHPGETVVVDLSLDEGAPAGVQWTLQYSRSDVSGIEVVASQAMMNAGKSVFCNPGSEDITCVIVGVDNAAVLPVGVVASARLSLAPDAPSHTVPLALLAPVGTSGNGDPLDVMATSGSVTVLEGEPSQVTPGNVSLTAGETQQFDAGVPAIWSLSPELGTITPQGVYTAPPVIASAQQVTVKASNLNDASLFATAVISLEPLTIDVTPAAVTLGEGQPTQFTAAVNGSSDSSVTWTISPAKGSISASGLYTAPPSIVSPQTVTVTATSAADPAKSATAVVTLSPPVAITLSPGAVTLAPGQTQQFNATVSGAGDKGVTWSINPPVGSISSSGLYSAPGNVTGLQTVTVTATSAADPAKLASARVTIVPPVEISIAPGSVELGSAQTQQFNVSVSGGGGVNTSSAAGPGVTWSIAPGVGSISATGLYTAPGSVSSARTVTVKATSTADPNCTATATVTLAPPSSGGLGLVAAYAFDEGSGSTAADLSGNGNAAQLTRTRWASSGKYGKALKFNGDDSVVAVEDSPSLQMTGGITLEAWVYPTSLDEKAWLISKGASIRLYTKKGKYPAAALVSGGKRYTTPKKDRLQKRKWTHLAATYDGATLKLYVNGELASSKSMSGPIDLSDRQLRIGAKSDSKKTFQGRMDEVRIYDRALSPAEIQRDMSRALTN